MDNLTDREIIFEFRSSGGFAQVCAVDVATAIEVAVITPTNTARADQQRLARLKLAKALKDHGIEPEKSDNSSAKMEKGNTSKDVLPSTKKGFWA